MKDNVTEYSSHFFDAGDGTDPLPEILHLAAEICPEADFTPLSRVHHDITAMFAGKAFGFKRNTMPYHTLRHTMMVALAATRFLHGLHFGGHTISPRTLFQGVLCAYFHDTGMLVKQQDPNPNGSVYITTHEKRSAEFLTEYVTQRELNPSLAHGAAIIIAYTWLGKDPATFPPHSPRRQMLGQVVGAADLLAQMADRYYLENLPLLFSELKQAGINTNRDVLELMRQTVRFYRDVVVPRFTTKYAEVFDAMLNHFVVRYGINRNLYVESIEKNLGYLQSILEQCETFDCVCRHLRRQTPAMFSAPKRRRDQRERGSRPVSNISKRS